MARIKDIQDNPLFAPEHKDSERKAKSLSAFLALPTILGIVTTQNQWIKRGSTIGFKEAFAESLSNLFREARKNPILNSMSGGPAIQRAIEVHEEAALSKLAKKGSGRNIGSDIPNIISHAESVSKLTVTDVRRQPYFVNRITRSYENALSAYKNTINPSDIVPDNLVPLLGQLPSDVIDPYKNRLLSIQQVMDADHPVRLLEEIYKTNKQLHSDLAKQVFQGNLEKQMEKIGLVQVGWIDSPHNKRGTLTWIDPDFDYNLNEAIKAEAKATPELKEFAKSRRKIWNTWTNVPGVGDFLEEKTQHGIAKHGLTYNQQLDALRLAKKRLEEGKFKTFTLGSKAITKTLIDLDIAIKEMTNLKMGMWLKMEEIRKPARRTLIEEIRKNKNSAYTAAKKHTAASVAVNDVKTVASESWKELTHIDRWNRFRQAIELVDSAIYHHSLVNSDTPLTSLKAFGSDKEILDFLKNEADPRYIGAVREVFSEISAEYTEPRLGPSRPQIIGDRLLIGKVREIVKEALDQPLIIQSEMRGTRATAFYKQLTQKTGGYGKHIIAVDMVKGERALAGVIKNSISNYEVGLSVADRKRIGNIKTFSARLKGRERLYKSIFEAAGQGALYESAYGTTRYSEGLAKMLSAFDSKIKEIKNDYNQLVKRAVNDPIAKRQLTILAEAANMSVDRYSSLIDSLKVNMELKTDLHGNIAHQRAILQIKIGQQTLKHSIPLERFGQFSTASFSRLYNSSLFLSSGLEPTISNVRSLGLAQIEEMFIRSEKIINDLVESGWNPRIAERQIGRMMSQYTDIAGTATEHVQDSIRGMKVFSEEFAVLAGRKPSYYYTTHALGKKSLIADASIHKTESTLAALDLEFSSPYATLAGSSRMVRDPRTRMFWMNYVLNKGSGTQEKIVNHYIVPDNWSLIKENVAKFMVRSQPGDTAAQDGYTKWFNWLDEQFKLAQKGMSEKGTDMITQKTLDPRIGTQIPTDVTFYNEKRSMIIMATDMYGQDALDKQVTWLGHNIGTADLEILNRSAKRILKASQGQNVIAQHKLNSGEKRLIERLIIDTSRETILAKGNIIDTYAWGRLLQTGAQEKTSLSLTSLFNSLMDEASQRVVSSKLDKRSWSKKLADAVNQSNGKITGSIKHMIDDLPSNVRGSIKRWIREDWKNVVATFGEGGHHDPGFDTRTDIILRDLLHWKTEEIRNKNPNLYAKILKIGTLSEEISEGRRFAWYHPLEIAQESDLYQLDPTGRAPDGTLLRSHLFAFSPNQAAKGLGAIFGPENYLPFGHKLNLQKQSYQVLSQKALLPPSGIEVAFSRTSASRSLFPVLEHSLDDLARDDLGFSMWMTTLRSSLTRERLVGQTQGGRLGIPPKSRIQLLAYYLPSNNSLVGEDTAMLTPGLSKAFRHLPAGGAGKTFKLYAPEAKHLLLPQIGERPIVDLLKDKAGRRFGKKLTMASWLRANGINSAIIDSVEAAHPGLTLEQFVEANKGDNILKLDLFGPETIDDFSPGAKNVLSPDTTLVEADKTRKAVWDTDTGKKYQLNTGYKYHITHPIKQAGVLKALSYDFKNEQFLFDITPIEEPGFTKLVDPLKLFKGNSVAEGYGYIMGKGIGAVLGAKKPNIAQTIELHMRRALTTIYRNHPNPTDQKRLIKKLILEAFEITDNEFGAMFRLKQAPISRLQSKEFGTSIIVPEVISTSEISLSNNQLFKGAVKMLQVSGVTHAEVKKIFMELNVDKIYNYAKRLGSKLTRDTVESQVERVYTIMKKTQKEILTRISKDVTMKATDQAMLINEMYRVLHKTETALFDPFLTLQLGKLEIEKFKEHGLFESGSVNTLLKGVYTEAASWALPTELSLSETLADVKGPLYKAVDTFGTPIKKTFSIWQVLLMYNAQTENDPLRADLFKQIIPKQGRYDKNIRSAMQTYYAASLSLRKGFSFDETKVGFKGARKVIKLDAIQKAAGLIKVIKDLNLNDEDNWTTIKKIMETSDDLKNEIEIQLAERNQPHRIHKLGLVSSEALKDLSGSTGLFGAEDSLLKLELPDMEKIFEDAGMKKSELAVVRDIQNKQRAHLTKVFRDALRDASADQLEKQRFDLYVKQFPSLAGDVTGKLDGIIVPFVIMDGPQEIKGMNGQHVLGTQANRTIQIADAITAYTEDLKITAERIVGDGNKVIPSNITDLQKAHLAKIGRPLTAILYTGLNNAAWKSNQFYSAGKQYGKAVNSVVLATNIIGSIRKLGAAKSQELLAKPGYDNAVLEALGALKKQAKGTQKRVLTALIEETKTITMQDVLHGISKPKNPKDAIGRILRSHQNQSFYGAAGTGLNERIMPSGQLAASIRTMSEGSSDLTVLLEALTGTDVKGRDVSEASLISKKAQHWREILTGKRKVVDALTRDPMFENRGIMAMTNAYVWHDELFRQVGMKSNEIDKILTVNQMELMLMGGDYDGDLVSRILSVKSMGEEMNKERIISDLKRIWGVDEFEKRMADGLEGKGIKALRKEWKTVQREGINIEISRLRENISWGAMKKGRGSLLQGGVGYGNLIREVNDGTDIRFLLTDLGQAEMAKLEDSQLKGVINTIIGDEAAEGMKSRGLLYMIQQTLTGPVGEQQKRWDVLFSGGTKSPMKVNIINKIDSIGKADNTIKVDENVVQFLEDVDAKFNKAEAINQSGVINQDYVKKRAQRLSTKLNDAWSQINKQTDLYYFDDLGEDLLHKSGEVKATWRQSRMTGLDYFNKYLAEFAHQVPIEKQKRTTSSILVSFQQDYAARTLFSHGFYDEPSRVNYGKSLKMMWNGLSADDARAKNMLIDMTSDYLQGQGNKIKAEAELIKQERIFKSVGEDIGFLVGIAARAEANQIVYGNSAAFLAGRGPRAGIYGILQDAFTYGSRAWIGNAFQEGISSADLASISEGQDMAKYIISRAFTDDTISTRAMLEQTSRTVGDMLHGVMQGRWAKRAGVAALALMILDPNTNSLLLPDQRGEGERHDIPSIQELSKTYRNRLVKFRENSPIFLDKMARAVGLPTFGGSPGYKNTYMPSPPPGMVNYTKIQHRRDPLTLSQMSKQVEGIMLR